MTGDANSTSDKLSVEYVRTGSLVPYVRNAKVHTEEQIRQIANSISEFSMCDPVGVWTDHNGDLIIVEGHGRVLALEQLGIDECPIIRLDHLTDEQRRAYAHVHNQLTMNTGFDEDVLFEDLSELDFNWDDLGFDVDFGHEEKKHVEVVEDEVPDDVPYRVSPGQVWRLGRHRLMCGDATSGDDVAKLMDGNRADACFTSPPYNMAVGGTFETLPHHSMNAGAAYENFSDALSDDDYSELLCGSLSNALSVCDDALFNIGILAGSKRGIADMLERFKHNWCDVVVWNKSNSLPLGATSQRGLISHRCELIFCFNQSGSRSFSHPQWEKGTAINRIDTKNAGDANENDYVGKHNATFPVEFAAEVVRNFTGDSVLDLFGGTGTTLIAAEQLGRTCYMMELDPHYCDMIIARWEHLTGMGAEVCDE